MIFVVQTAPVVLDGERQVWTTMSGGHEILRHGQGVPLLLPKMMDWLQKSAAQQANPMQFAVMTGQFVTMLIRETATLVQHVFVQVGVGKIRLVVLHATN